MSAASAIPPARILIAEDEPEIRDYLGLALKRLNCAIDFAENGEEVMQALANSAVMPSLIILDVVMPRKDGIDTLKEIRSRDLRLPVIMLSGLSSTVNIVDAMKSGANNFLTKPVSYEELCNAVEQLLPAAPAPATPKTKPSQSLSGEPGIWEGAWSKRLEPLLQRIAMSEAPILLQGETGSGKEVIARRIHNQSRRSGEVFFKLNCAALPAELVESELFGYERGAFTGAFVSNPGKFEMANGGTILLDEIGDMDLALQAKLLQVLQDHEFLRLGARKPTRVDVRVIAATHRDLAGRIAVGAFREDLYYRLNVLKITIPPLRDRRDEIIPLALTFLRKYQTDDGAPLEISAELKAALLRYIWPGNIRELENLMRQYTVVRDPGLIIRSLKMKPSAEERPEAKPHFGAVAPPASNNLFGRHLSLEDSLVLPNPSPVSNSYRTADAGVSELAKVDQARQKAETEVILQALHSTLWNRKRAASLLGTDYKALLYKMKKLGIG